MAAAADLSRAALCVCRAVHRAVRTLSAPTVGTASVAAIVLRKRAAGFLAGRLYLFNRIRLHVRFCRQTEARQQKRSYHDDGKLERDRCHPRSNFAVASLR